MSAAMVPPQAIGYIWDTVHRPGNTQMRPSALATLLVAIAATPALAQMSPPPHPLGTLPPGPMVPMHMAQTAPATAPAPAMPARPPAGAPIARPGNDIGTGQSLPLSNNAGNILPSDTTTTYAARLPNPDIGENASPRAFVEAARAALAAGRTGEAQEAMERAETRLLIRSVRPSQANMPSREPVIQQITEARRALGQGDRAGALARLDAALNNPELGQPTR
jgi:hypothetical protein